MSRIQGEIIQIPTTQWSRVCFISPNEELWLSLLCPFSHCMPCFHIFICFSYFLGPFFSNLMFSFNILFILPMNGAFFHSFSNSFNFLWQNIHSTKIFIFCQGSNIQISNIILSKMYCFIHSKKL